MRRLFFRNRKGQATTELVLLFPIFMLVCFLTAKIFALLVVVQKLEIAAAYAGRKWQVESHRSAAGQGQDQASLLPAIRKQVDSYIRSTPMLNIPQVNVSAVPTAVWNIVTVSFNVSMPNIPLLCGYPPAKSCKLYPGAACARGYSIVCGGQGVDFTAVKYVPNRDRPIQYSLPGLQ